MIRPVASTLAALVLSLFMIRDRSWTDSGTLIMNAILWGLSIYLWTRWAREQRAPSDGA